jgi:serralysin
LELDDSAFAALAPGALAASAFVAGTAAQDADDRIIFNAATGAVLYDPDGTGSAPAIQFATLQPGASLTNADIFVI